MYFGKPIPEWITEHRNDTISPSVDYCEKSAQISNGLMKRIADGGFSHDYDLSAYAFFVRELRYARLLDQCKIDACEYKRYASNLPYNFYYKCDQCDLIGADAAINTYNGFIKNMNENP